MTIPDGFSTLGPLIAEVCRRHAGRVALRDGAGRETGFRAFGHHIAELNAAVAARGLRKGDRVAVLSRNRLEFAEIFGLAQSGLVIVPLNWRLTAEELRRLLRHADPALIFADRDHLPVIEAAQGDLPDLRGVICFDGPAGAAEGYVRFRSGPHAPAPSVAVAPEDPLCIIYTSGTTGQPKGIVLSHRAVLANMRCAASEVLGLGADDRVLAVMPFFHVGGLWFHFYPALMSGCTVTVLPEFDPARVIETLERDRITVVHLVPTMVAALVRAPQRADHDLSLLRLIFYAAAPMPSALLLEAMEALPLCAFVQGYGSTEAGIVSMLDPQHHRRAVLSGDARLLRSCGLPVAGCQVQIRGAGGAMAGPGEIGELVVSGAGCLSGLWSEGVTASPELRDGWLRTGDVGFADAEGVHFLVDRKNDMIITGGENVYPTEVEDQLMGVSGIAEAAVFGLPDPKWVERVVAAIVPRPDCEVSADRVIAELRARLASYKCPKQVFIVDSLPKSGVGKVLRRALREQFSEVSG
ncbi:AMP-binding protein [Salipiger sp. P9]|uniref:class I adenylate-forming enzyme family protein n=1 Tax=Salipiger pentaromativorans TaxID=2943193 RepID=UPI0021585081|nr:AMP-binding protein [Salipiger pentaromativorans]MCR8547573.1 AMP-binding protein [Salipiger pentaromativorans]